MNANYEIQPAQMTSACRSVQETETTRNLPDGLRRATDPCDPAPAPRATGRDGRMTRAAGRSPRRQGARRGRARERCGGGCGCENTTRCGVRRAVSSIHRLQRTYHGIGAQPLGAPVPSLARNASQKSLPERQGIFCHCTGRRDLSYFAFKIVRH